MRTQTLVFSFFAIALLAVWPDARADDFEDLSNLAMKLTQSDDPCQYWSEYREKSQRFMNSTGDANSQQMMQTMLAQLNTVLSNCDKKKELQEEKAGPLDVRYVTGPTRVLTDEEIITLRKGLKWQPESSPLTLGGEAHADLVDAQGRNLASMTVSWTSIDKSKNPTRAHFSILLENRSNCVLSTDAQLLTPDGLGPVFGSTTWLAWTNLHQPDSGTSQTLKVNGTFGRPTTALILQPDQSGSVVSQCRTQVQ